MQCFALTALMSVLWFVVGYTLAFGSAGVDQGPWIGDLGNLFLAKVSMDSMSGSIPETLFVMFQLTFAVITPALIVGGFAERMRFSAMLIFSSLWLILVYAPICHWVWGGGWLGEMAFRILRWRCRSYHGRGCCADCSNVLGEPKGLWANGHAPTQSDDDGHGGGYALGGVVRF